jgi:fimbrial chaperone protein
LRPSTSDPSSGAAPRGPWRRAFALGLALAAGLAVAGQPSPARAASFSVDPTLIQLSPRASSTLLVVRNESAEPVRLQLSAFAWAQSVAGEMQLEPTEDLVFFPTLFTLGARQERKVRVGTTAAYGNVEKSYRLFVEELPPEEKAAGSQSGVRMLTRMGIPVFLLPSASRAGAGLSGVALSGGTVAFTLENTGTVHLLPDAVRVVGSASTGETVIDRQLQGWYVLAGTARRFTLTVPSPECSRVRSMAFEVQVAGTLLKERLETPKGTCGP